jgi:hypothetical protein
VTRRTGLLAALALVVVAAGCRDIVVTEDGVTSHASRAVSPATVTVGGRATAAVEIRLRDCDRIRWEVDSPVRELTVRPVAVVTAADGAVVYQNGLLPFTEPAGARVVEGTDGDADRILVPVAGAPTPLTIETTCTSYAGAYNPPLRAAWELPTCRTSTRRCIASEPGAGELVTTGLPDGSS